VHLNDWQTALAPAWLHYDRRRAASIVTVHNIAFQGNFGASHLHALGLPEHAWRFDGVEFHGQLSFLKAGLQLATLIDPPSARPMPAKSRMKPSATDWRRCCAIVPALCAAF
jgi:starch synthase